MKEGVRRKWKAKGSGLLPMDPRPETQTRWCVQRATSRSITLVPWLNTGSLTVMSGSMSVTSVRKPLRDKIICEYISVSDNMNCTNENTWKLFGKSLEKVFWSFLLVHGSKLVKIWAYLNFNYIILRILSFSLNLRNTYLQLRIFQGFLAFID